MYIYISGIIGVIYTILATIRVCNASQTHNQIYFENMTWNVLVTGVAIFVFFQYRKKECNMKFVRMISRTTLFVYMLHPLLIDRLDRININVVMGNSWWTTPALTVSIYIACTGIALIVNGIKDFVALRITKKC